MRIKIGECRENDSKNKSKFKSKFISREIAITDHLNANIDISYRRQYHKSLKDKSIERNERVIIELQEV